VMTYAPNGTLRQRHPHGSHLSTSQVISYIGQVADALQYAHEKKVIHRDVKPENMLIGQNGDILLSDFGIAVVAQSSRYSSQEVGGTAAYMAPEQLQGRASPASDQYALAVTAYE
jgi:eukaryotic-like serine/threonine-protein kinase